MDAKKINPKLRGYLDLVAALGEILGPDCEVLLHDLSCPESSVIACANTELSGRGLGSPITDFGLSLMKDKSCRGKPGLFNYFGKTEDGRVLRSGVCFIKDEAGEVIGHLCINMDISKAMAAKEFIDGYTRAGAGAGISEHFSKELGGVVETSIEQLKAKWGRDLAKLPRGDKVAAVGELEEKGFFFVKGAIEVLAQEMGKSKFTLYAYLRDSRKLRHTNARRNTEAYQEQ